MNANEKGLSACAQAFVATLLWFDCSILTEQKRIEPGVITAAQNERGNPPEEQTDEGQGQQHLPASWSNIACLPFLFTIERNAEEHVAASLILLHGQVQRLNTWGNIGTLFHGTFPFRINYR